MLPSSLIRCSLSGPAFLLPLCIKRFLPPQWQQRTLVGDVDWPEMNFKQIYEKKVFRLNYLLICLLVTIYQKIIRCMQLSLHSNNKKKLVIQVALCLSRKWEQVCVSVHINCPFSTVKWPWPLLIAIINKLIFILTFR